MADPAPRPSTPLFRTEALEHVGTRRYGTVVLARPVSFTFLTALFSAIAIGIVVFFVLFSYQRKIHVAGVLLPEAGLIRVVSSQVGVVSQRKVHEGQTVKGGDPLFVLTSERASTTQGDAEKAISGLLRSRLDSLAVERRQLRQQSSQRMEASAQRANALAADVEQVTAQIALQQRRVDLAQNMVTRYNDLQNAKFVSAAQVQDKQAELLDQGQRLADLQRAKAASARDLASLRADLKDQKVQAERDQENAARNISTIEQDLTENEARREIIVRAPQDGTVSAVNAEPGQTVTANQTLVSLLPTGTVLQAELYAPSRAAGFVKPGMDVLLRYQAYPYEKFGQHHGKVREVSNTAMRPEDMTLPSATLSPGANSEPLYRVRVELDQQSVPAYGTEEPLKPGMLLDASVMLEKRRLYEWVLEPLYTVTGRL